MGRGDDDRRLAGFGLGSGNRGDDLVVVVPVNLLHMPAGSSKAPFYVLGPGKISLPFDGDAVAVVDIDQVAQFEVTGQSCRLVTDSLLQAAIASQGINIMVDRLEVGGIEAFGRHAGGDAHARRRWRNPDPAGRL